MLFTSFEFYVFLPAILILYWLLKNHFKLQNGLLLIASCIFYGWWDYRFLFLLALSTFLDYSIGLQISGSHAKNRKKRWLVLSLILNLGLLGFFKYYNFFVESWIAAFAQLGYKINPFTINIVLPVGISFYTFHGLSYVIDIYYGRCRPTRNWIDYALFVSYFPLLVAGPIERATHLLPQIQKPRTFNKKQWVEGIKLMLWGLFKKIVIADSLAPAVNEIFGRYTHYSGGTLILGALYFSFQIYCDFSGYSDIARGISKLFGIELLLNFDFPYFSKSIPDFWKRWHISLSSWFRDYVYIPLGGSRTTKAKALRNVFIVFLISGFWHGANWTFIIWGCIHALLFMPSFMLRGAGPGISVSNNNRYLSKAFSIGQMLFTFSLVSLAWVFFRAPTLNDAVHFIGLFNFSGFHYPIYLLLLISLIVLEYLVYRKKDSFIFYCLIFAGIIAFIYNPKSEFIYFQF